MPGSRVPGGQPRPVAIRGESIRLDQLLKWAGVSQTGGQSKAMIMDGLVRVNDQIETRRSRAVVPGDKIEIGRSQFSGPCSLVIVGAAEQLEN